MYLVYGNYTHATDSVGYTIGAQCTEDEAGNPYEVTYTWNLQGRIDGDTTTAVVANCRLLEAAYAVWFKDLVFYDSNGVMTHQLRNAGSKTGVRVHGPVSYPQSEGGELSTFRNVAVTLSATYPAIGANAIRSYHESLSFSGGGPERAVIECANVPPQEQLIKAYTTTVVRQSGNATGAFAYPVIPAPLFPGKERVISIPAGNPVYGSPKFRNGIYVDFPVQWSYEFISGTPLFAYPNPWPQG